MGVGGGGVGGGGEGGGGYAGGGERGSGLEGGALGGARGQTSDAVQPSTSSSVKRNQPPPAAAPVVLKRTARAGIGSGSCIRVVPLYCVSPRVCCVQFVCVSTVVHAVVRLCTCSTKSVWRAVPLSSGQLEPQHWYTVIASTSLMSDHTSVTLRFGSFLYTCAPESAPHE